MKKINYLLAFVAVAMAFSACNPLDKTYKELGPVPTLIAAKTITYTLTPSDYKILPSTVPASTALAFIGAPDANQYVPTILNSKYGTYPDGSTASITYNTIVTASATTPALKLADSVYSTAVLTSLNQPTGLEYTLSNPSDYLLLSGNTHADFSISQMLSWLNEQPNPNAAPPVTPKYPSPVANQLEVLTWILYPPIQATSPQSYPGLNVIGTTGTGSSAITTVTGSFVYLNGTWIQAYQISNAQYSAIGHGLYNQFTASTDAAYLVTYLNGILKTDPTIAGTATIGSTEYVSFNYYNNSVSPAVTSQRVLELVFNGTNWITGTVPATTTTATGTFTKANGVWMGDPTVYYTLTTADTKLIANSGIGGSAFAATLTNLGSYGDFETTWMSLSTPNPTSYLDQSLILVLTTDFPTPKLNTPYKVTFLYYTGGKDVSTTYGFTYNGTTWTATQ